LDVGLPDTLLVPILMSIRKSIQELRDVLSSIELRMVGSSLLIVYEGDWDRAETGVQWLAKQPASMSSGEDGGEEEEMDEDTEVEGWEEDEESEEEDSSDEGLEMERPCVVRLIDFAHTRLKPGEGPDVGLLKGFDTLLSLLDGRIASLA
jgi:inositol-polyphosphate multikinase